MALVTSPIPFAAPPTVRGGRLGCLTPSAAPSILFPGSPIRGAPCSGWATTTAGSEAVGSATPVSDEEIREFNVGWDGRSGNVGEGWSRP